MVLDSFLDIDTRKRESIAEAMEIVRDSARWEGASETGRFADEEASKQLKDSMDYGRIFTAMLDEEDLAGTDFRKESERVYRELLEFDEDDRFSTMNVEAARTLEESVPFQVGDDIIKEKLKDFLDGEVTDKDLKNAFTILNSLRPSMEGSEIEYNSERVSCREGDLLLDELGREIYNSLDGEARAFFEFSRRPRGRRPGGFRFQGERPAGFHFNWTNHADPAKKSSPDEIVEERYRELREDASGFDTEGLRRYETKEDPLADINAERWMAAINLANRFRMDVQYDIIEDFGNELQSIDDYIQRKKHVLGKGNELHIEEVRRIAESLYGEGYSKEELGRNIKKLRKALGKSIKDLDKIDLEEYKERVEKATYCREHARRSSRDRN